MGSKLDIAGGATTCATVVRCRLAAAGIDEPALECEGLQQALAALDPGERLRPGGFHPDNMLLVSALIPGSKS